MCAVLMTASSSQQYMRPQHHRAQRRSAFMNSARLLLAAHLQLLHIQVGVQVLAEQLLHLVKVRGVEPRRQEGVAAELRRRNSSSGSALPTPVLTMLRMIGFVDTAYRFKLLHAAMLPVEPAGLLAQLLCGRHTECWNQPATRLQQLDASKGAARAAWAVG